MTKCFSIASFRKHYLCLSPVVRRSRLPPYLDSGAPGHSFYIWLALADQSPKEDVAKNRLKAAIYFTLYKNFYVIRKLLKIVLKIRVVLQFLLQIFYGQTIFLIYVFFKVNFTVFFKV